MRCLVLAGLIGAGKSTLARALAGTHDVFDFDVEWHERMERAKLTPMEAARRFSGLVNARGRDVVIDGWYTWHFEWFKDEKDATLHEFARGLRRHSPELVHLVMSDDQAFDAYREKQQRGEYKCPVDGEIVSGPLDDARAYRASLKARREALARRVATWAR